MDEIKDSELEKLLSQAATSERRAFKRATAYTIIPVLIGLVLVGLSAYQLNKLDERKKAKEREIAEKEKEIEVMKTEAVRVQQEASDASAQVAQAKLALDEIQQKLVEAKESSNPTKEIDAALQLVKDTDESLQTVQTVQTVKTADNLRWIIISTDRTLEEAEFEVRKARKLGYENVSIYFRQNSYRVVIELPTGSEARERLPDIRARLRNDAYRRALDQWCPTPQKRDGYFQCAE